MSTPLESSPRGRGRIFDPSINIGTVVTILLALCAGATATVGWVMHLQSQAFEMQRDVGDSRKRAEIWLPRIEQTIARADALEGSNKVQDNRIENLGDSVREIRHDNAEIKTLLGQIREDMAAVKARMGLDHRTENVPAERRGGP